MSPRLKLVAIAAFGAAIALTAPAGGCAAAAEGAAQTAPAADVLPVRGLHVSVYGNEDMDLCEKFIREALPAEGANVLVLEIDYGYPYASQPEVGSSEGLSKENLQRLLRACRESGVKLVPQINCLGHQSWHQSKGALLRAFPQFDETPWIADDRRDFYCRSYCPLHPDLHKVLFALMDELAGDCGATDFHVGMDEVFFIAEDQCPRCGGKDRGELFGGEVRTLHDHLAEAGRTMWMWGDRLIDGSSTGIGEWEASTNGTYPAVDMVPKDIIICDWHYNRAPETPRYFVEKGFRVVACPWRREQVALEQLQMIRDLRKENDRALGMLQTTWCGFGSFVRAYYGETQNRSAAQAAQCFKTLFAAMRGEGSQETGAQQTSS